MSTGRRLQVYYSTPPKMPEVKGNWCHSCFMEERKETLEIDGAKIKKIDVVKRKNDEEQEEAWVACDQCNRWVHQICGLFNKGRNDSDVPYICPECLARGTALATAATSAFLCPPAVLADSGVVVMPDVSGSAQRYVRALQRL